MYLDSRVLSTLTGKKDNVIYAQTINVLRRVYVHFPQCRVLVTQECI